MAAAWISGAAPALAQGLSTDTPPTGPASGARRVDPERRARMRQMRAELGGHIATARAAIAQRRAAPATETVERAQTLLLNLASAGADIPGTPAGASRRGQRARAQLDQARGAIASGDFAAAEAVLAPMAERLQRAPRRG
jgi:hypothetical protein